MLKTIVIHLIGGILAALGKYFAFSFFKEDVLLGFLLVSIVMIFYYIAAGALLKNVSFGKAVLFMQLTAFLSENIVALGDKFVDIMEIFNGGSDIWLCTSYIATKGGKWYPFLAHVTLFFIFPIFIYLGQGLARKEFPKIKDKFMIVKVALLHLIVGLIYSGCHFLCYSVLENHYVMDILYISAGIVVVLFIAGGIWLKDISYTRIFLIMLNITLVGNALLVSPLASDIAYPFMGGGGVIFELSIFLFPDGILSEFKHTAYLIPPLLVIFGSYIGKRFTKKKTA